MTRPVRVYTLTLALLLIIFLPSTSTAQSPPSIGFGLKAGVIKSRIKLDPEAARVDSVWGGTGGVFVSNQVIANLGFQVEGLYTKRGTRFALAGIPIPASIDLSYIDVSLLAKGGVTVDDSVRLVVSIGPQLSINTAAELTLEDNGEARDFRDEIEKTDFGWTIGVGVEMDRFSLDGRYTLGQTNILKNPDPEVQGLKSRSFTLMFGVRLTK